MTTVRSDNDDQQPPRTPEEFGDWFANTSDHDRRRFADFHGDAIAHRRDQRKEGDS